MKREREVLKQQVEELEEALNKERDKGLVEAEAREKEVGRVKGAYEALQQRSEQLEERLRGKELRRRAEEAL